MRSVQRSRTLVFFVAVFVIAGGCDGDNPVGRAIQDFNVVSDAQEVQLGQ